MLAAGVPVSLAVDGAASNEAADMQSKAHAALLVAGRVVAEHDAISGLDLAELRHDAQTLVDRMLER